MELVSKKKFIIYYGSKIHSSVTIDNFSIIGKPSRPHQSCKSKNTIKKSITRINANCILGSYVSIGLGSIIDCNTIIEDSCIIENDVTIGKNCFIVHGARICANSIIGDNCVIGGFIAERSIIGNHSRIFGKLIHKQNNPIVGWDNLIEPAPCIGSYVFIGMGAIIIGNIEIEDHVYVCAGAIVTKNIKSNTIVKNTNQQIPFSKWSGKLSKSKFFEEEL